MQQCAARGVGRALVQGFGEGAARAHAAGRGVVQRTRARAVKPGGEGGGFVSGQVKKTTSESHTHKTSKTEIKIQNEEQKEERTPNENRVWSPLQNTVPRFFSWDREEDSKVDCWP